VERKWRKDIINSSEDNSWHTDVPTPTAPFAVGGILGNQFGKGNGRAAATVAGAVAGGVAGNNIAAADEESGDSRPQYKTVRHCPPAAASRRKVVAYDVEYRYRGDVYSSRLAFDPGDRLRVKVSVTPSE
jgi:uncharacterized protein YcfJ